MVYFTHSSLYERNNLYSGTSQRGPSKKETLYYIPLHNGQNQITKFYPPYQSNAIEPLKEDNLYTGDKLLQVYWSQSVRCSEVALYLIIAF